MKNKLSLAILLIGIVVAIFFVYGVDQVFNSFPQMVKYSFDVPQMYNATEFRWSSTLPFFSFSPEHNMATFISNTYDFSTKIMGVARVGETYKIYIYYYGIENNASVSGLNIQQAPTLLGEETYHVQIKELENHQVSTSADGWYWITIVGGSIVIIVFSIIIALCCLVDAENKNNEKCNGDNENGQ
jgi:hypothetical protein